MLKKKNLIFVGAPGAGKGTFSAMLLENHPMAHISTGDLLRDEVKRDTKLGREAAGLMKEGKLVPDEIIAGMVRARLAQPDCENGFILDGFPRTLPQAAALDKLLASKNLKLDAVVELKVDDKILVDRIENRARETLAAGGTVRADDNAEALKTRLMAYYRETAPLIGYYFANGLLKAVDGMAAIGDVTKQVNGILDGISRA